VCTCIFTPLPVIIAAPCNCFDLLLVYHTYLSVLWCACAVPSDTTVTVTCSRTGTNFPQSFDFTVSAVSGKGRCADTQPAQWKTTVSSSCCVSGATYGRHPTASSCLSTLGCTPAVGFINQAPATGAGTQSYPLVYGTCASSSSTGYAPITCTNTGSSSSSFTFLILNQYMAPQLGVVTRSFYVGCVVPSGGNKCRPDRFWGANACATNAVRSCGGNLDGAFRTVALTCQCSSVRWILSSSVTAPTYFEAERINGLCPA
jgi:hypothetical protein